MIPGTPEQIAAWNWTSGKEPPFLHILPDAQMPTAPPPYATNTGRWVWAHWYDATGTTLVSRCPIWQDDPITPPEVRHRRTAREVIAAIRAEQDAMDTIIATFKAIVGAPTVAQHRRFSLDMADGQARMNRLLRRATVLLLDAGDGNAVETPAALGV